MIDCFTLLLCDLKIEDLEKIFGFIDYSTMQSCIALILWS